MASIENLLLENLKGSIGDVVIYRRNGKMVLRSKARKPKKAASPALKKQQKKFAEVMKYLKATKPFIQVGFAVAGLQSSAFDKAKSRNLHNHPDEVSGEIAGWLQLSEGEKANAQNVQVEKLENNEIIISWGKAEEGKPYSENDVSMALALKRGSTEAFYILNGPARRNRSLMLEISGWKEGEIVDVFLSFRANGISRKKDRKDISDSVWVGSCER
ncbi:MAG: DUF6266 family protein [Bacteroidales bacterium]|nr:DUF6266 family protein [Bacteroidales bacterium]MCF8388260.1 DUF6266 family protein [Bacteroidales bacterium]MCF8399690.1 DUF6266 family protein [Bacteroidales bacterium]